MIQCFIVDDAEESLPAILRSSYPWIAVIRTSAIWGQIDWYPRLVRIIEEREYDLVVPATNAPAPNWQSKNSPAWNDVFRHRKYAATLSGNTVDVTDSLDRAAPVAAVMARDNAPDILSGGLVEMHERASEVGRVGFAQSVYAIQC